MESVHPARVELHSVREILKRYCQALTGTEVQIRSTEELSQQGIGWTSIDEPTTEGTTIFLPPYLRVADTVLANFQAYKVLATHQSAHLEFGTFWFAFERESALFRDFRPVLVEITGRANGALTDFTRFFDLFLDRRLATDIFTVVEDCRVDARLRREYAGIRGIHRVAQERSLAKRPAIRSLPLREALLEILIQLSIGRQGSVEVPRATLSRLRLASCILRSIQNSDSTVEDAAEATVRLYCLIEQVPNVELFTIPAELWDTFDLSETMDMDEDEMEEMLYGYFADAEEMARINAAYKSPMHVDFRGDLKPELSQTVLNLSHQVGEEDTRKTYEALKELFEKNAEIELEERKLMTAENFARNLLKERGKAFLSGELPKPEQAKAKARIRKRWTAAAGLSEEFYYDEWDFLANNYKYEWCRLKQRVLEEGSGGFFAETLRQYEHLVTDVRKEFENLKFDRFRRVKRLDDGEDLDFDAVVDALVEKKVGAPFSDRVYWRRRKQERDVCVGFLLDLSASTYERVDNNSRAFNPTGKFAGSPKRIIDLEKEAIIVLTEALEAIGDPYGIYGFSGHGRDDVEFTIIKDIEEGFSPTIERRIAAINPIQGTRMGPAIRHLSAILDNQEANTKLLILISDGRPQDFDYGSHQAGEEWGIFSRLPDKRLLLMDDATELLKKEYAIYDTRMALLEARQKNITTFCLTIDKTGHDYLKVMCGNLGYEVLDDIHALPSRLPTLYRRLTARV